MKKQFKQTGLTLIELIASLAVFAMVVAGALSLYNSANASQNSTQMLQVVTALRGATQQIWQGQGSYETSGTNLNDVLVTSNRVPSTVKVDTSTSPDTLTHPANGTITIASTGNGFTMTLTNIEPELCVPMMTGASGWASVQAGSGAARTSFPINPTTATTDCATGTTIVFTGS